MINRVFLTAILFATAVAPVFGFSAGPPADRVGLDGGASCTACHRVFGTTTQQLPNADPSGSLRIETKPYRAGAKQLIRVILSHPDAQRWGFELTARLRSDNTKPAGTFALEANAPLPLRIVEAGGNQYVTQNADSTQRGVRGSVYWDLEWTAPATNVGDILIAVAGNAANGNNNNQGDRIYTATATISPEAPCALTATPTISAIVNGASNLGSGNTVPRTLDAGFASGSELTIWGTGFQAGTETRLNAGYLAGRRVPTELGCVGVEVGGQRARLSFAGANQVNAQIPNLTALGLVPVVVIANPGTSNERRSAQSYIRLDGTAPSLFQYTGTKFAAARFQDGTPVGTTAVDAAAKAAKVGDVIAIYANGLGATDPAFEAGQIVTGIARITTPIIVEFNGTVVDAANVVYAGLSPGSPSSLYQINLRIPANARKGANALRIRQGSFQSQDGVTVEVQ